MTRQDEFLSVQGPTNQSPYLIDVDYAEGIYIYDKSGKSYMDMIAGVAVNNIGHKHPKVISALKTQIDRHLHVMVYGEFIQDSQLNFSKTLTSLLPENRKVDMPVKAYFDNLAQSVIDSQKTKIIPLYKRPITWISAAAAVVLVLLHRKLQ